MAGEGEPPLATRIGQAVILHRGGDREEARERMLGLWRHAEGGDAVHRCALAHFLAGTEEDPAAALEWDRAALAEADALVAGRAAPRAVVALYPLLYLQLAADLARSGDVPAAGHALRCARAAARRLAPHPYADRLLARAAALEARLPAGRD